MLILETAFDYDNLIYSINRINASNFYFELLLNESFKTMLIEKFSNSKHFDHISLNNIHIIRPIRGMHILEFNLFHEKLNNQHTQEFQSKFFICLR